MDEAELHRYATLLEEVSDVYSVLVEPAVVPNVGSLAAGELQTARELATDGGLGGEEPIYRAYGLATMYYSATLELARAMVTLMTGQFSSVPVAVLARSLVEVASQAWWLLEPEIGCSRRVRRLQALRYRSASEGERVARADGAASDEYHRYTETMEQVKRYSLTLGLEMPSQDGQIYVCGEERLPTASRRVVAMFADIDVPSVYSLYSGFPHGELFALRQGFAPSSAGKGHPRFRTVVTDYAVKGVVAVASWALYAPAARLARLFGLGIPEAPKPK
jgi:hypothetical protein